MENGVLSLNKDTFSKLIQKHPNGKNILTASQGILVNGPLQNINPAKFQSIDQEITRKAAIRTKGSSGQSGMDVDGWCRILGHQLVIAVRHLRMYSKNCVLILLKLLQ